MYYNPDIAIDTTIDTIKKMKENKKYDEKFLNDDMCKGGIIALATVKAMFKIAKAYDTECLNLIKEFKNANNEG